MYSTTWIAAAVRSVLYASALSAGVLLCASSAHADDRDQLKSIQADIAARQRAIKQQQQQRASLLAQLKAQEEAIAAAARKLRETQDSLNQLNKQIDEMNAALEAGAPARVSGAEPRRAARCRFPPGAAYRHPDGAQR